MTLRYTDQAKLHLATIFDFICSEDRQAATIVISRIRASAQALCQFPYLGHIGHVPGTLELVVVRLPYVIAYRIDIGDEDQIVILGVFHFARKRH
ncbi:MULTISPECIES: type II toxin-antitoxin system RelE/ParE family toxin [Alphaproteobacteria]|uniref:type II toxin-antitoxin system RelE/ParE family toxin n=1 Tax=Alphaproteobacteria TaxID=28211 RepID=UPI003264E687